MIADKRGMSITEVMQMDYLTFTNWILYYSVKLKKHDKLDYYLAQITGFLSQKKRWKINDFLIKFADDNKQKVKLSGHSMAQLFKGLLKAEDVTKDKK